MKLRAKLVVIALSISPLFVMPVNAAVKDGASCSQNGSIAKANNFQYRCIKLGKKLTWQKIADQIVSKQEIYYRLNNGELERRAFSGAYFKSDSRSVKNFSPVRAKAYTEMNNLSKSSSSSFNLLLDLRTGFPPEIREYNLRKIRESFAIWSKYVSGPVDVKVLLATERDLSYIRDLGEFFSDAEGAMDRLAKLNPARENVWITGSAGYFPDRGVLTGKLFLGTRSEAKTERYSPEWIQVAVHETFHVIQDLWIAGTRNDSHQAYQARRPQHYTEGAANFVGYSLSSNNLGWYSDAMDISLARYWNYIRGWKPAKTESDIINLLIATETNESQQAFELSYPLGSLFYEWITGTYGVAKFIELSSETKNYPNFEDNVKKVFGVSKRELYSQSAPYILSVFKRIGIS